MSTNQKQAALTALKHFYYSLYKNSDLAFALIGVKVYGVNEMDKSEYNSALNSLLSMYAKFNDLSTKNNSMNTIQKWQQQDEYFNALAKEWINTALDNFKNLINKLYNEIHKKEPDIYSIMNNFML